MNRQQELERCISGGLLVAQRAQYEADTNTDEEIRQAMQRLADSERQNVAQNQERLNALLQKNNDSEIK